MSGFLEKMATRSRERVDAARLQRPQAELRDSSLSRPRSRPLDGFGETFDLIAEVKPRSPSEGIFPERPPAAAARGYEQGGAAVISVLTEPSEFGGSLPMLRAVAEAVSIPVMAKDFLVDPYQVYQAREAGADGILVIARILDDDAATRILDAAGELGMFSLLEAFDRADLARLSALAAGRSDVLIGVNCRDLETLGIVPELHDELAGLLPTGLVAVAESAITGPADVERVASLGYAAALVGSALMRAGDATGLVRAMIEAGRRRATVAS
ncbi:MAG TPA: indole-3-glycerol phosphate synthase TrpC [Acidimicrobiia bacterium]|nr:indole-3-glycerol phosphate synthase TrpC [Acidimicrobiia bacterium]